MKATHIAVIKIMNQEVKYNVVIVEQKGGKIVVQQVKKGKPYGPTFWADSVAAI